MNRRKHKRWADGGNQGKKRSKRAVVHEAAVVASDACCSEHACAAWPARGLIFKWWGQLAERDFLLRDVLLSRGWVDGGTPCTPEDTSQLPLIVAGKHPTERLPRRAFYITGEDKETRVLHALPQVEPASSLSPVSRFHVSGFPGAEPACYKTSTARLLRGHNWIPQTFVLPQEALAFKAQAAGDVSCGSPSVWVGKPQNLWAGKGIVVLKAGTRAFTAEFGALKSQRVGSNAGKGKQGSGAEAASQSRKKGVVQRYIPNPLLVSGYKFHLRMYLLLTQCKPSVRAYVHNDSHVMFCTLPFTMEDIDRASAFGGRKATKNSKSAPPSFEKRAHLSNYDINATADNFSAYMAQKGDVGPGCCWGMRRFESWLQKARPDISHAAMWQQIETICHHTANYIATYPTVTKYEAIPFRNSELFGLDMMLDDTGKMYLLECNNSPGLEYCGSHAVDGTTPNPDEEENDHVTKGMCHDRLALLGMDREVCTLGNDENFIRVC